MKPKRQFIISSQFSLQSHGKHRKHSPSACTQQNGSFDQFQVTSLTRLPSLRNESIDGSYSSHNSPSSFSLQQINKLSNLSKLEKVNSLTTGSFETAPNSHKSLDATTFLRRQSHTALDPATTSTIRLSSVDEDFLRDSDNSSSFDINLEINKESILRSNIRSSICRLSSLKLTIAEYERIVDKYETKINEAFLWELDAKTHLQRSGAAEMGIDL